MGNIDGLVKDVRIPANQTVRVSHNLQIIPTPRIILSQRGGGTITDGNFTRNYIELINNGGTEARLRIIIVKD